MKKKVKVIVGVIIIVLIIFIGGVVIFKTNKKLKETEGVMVVPTMQDKIDADSSWCATFELVWNDMKNEVVKNDIVFEPQEEYAKNLKKI